VGDTVEMFRIQIGQVEHFKIDQRDEMAAVELRIQKGIKIYKDANASIKTIDLIGDRHVSIDLWGGAAS
jgi:phospholipid/cholesterol/gamma-HCH transport system substrate-binding protein